MRWDPLAELCGNCKHWPLSGYGKTKPLTEEPSGLHGHHTDGSVSDCRHRSPVRKDPGYCPGENRSWPQTGRDEGCGDFVNRLTGAGIKRGT